MAPEKIAIAARNSVLILGNYVVAAARAEKSVFDVDAPEVVLYKSLPSTANKTDAADDSVSEN
jgi:hypothetical protein